MQPSHSRLYNWGSGLFILPSKWNRAASNGGEWCEYQTREDSHCLSDEELEGVPKQKSQQKSENARLAISGYVSPPLWCRDLASNPTWQQETEDLPNKMPPGHCGVDSVGQTVQCWHAAWDCRATGWRATILKRWFGHLQRKPRHQPQKQLLRCRPTGMKRRPGGTA